jgi:predicted glycosyltransferase
MTKVLIYVQHLLGVGHVKRASLIAKALRNRDAEVLFVSGGLPNIHFTKGLNVFQLPGCRAKDATFKEIVDEKCQIITDDWKTKRQNLLLAEAKRFNPDIILTEMFPFGRNQFRFELISLLEWGKTHKKRIYASVRDVLVSKNNYKKSANIINQFYDGVLMHSDPSIIPFDYSFPYFNAIKSECHYTGFVAEQRNCKNPQNKILVSMGGSNVGKEFISELRVIANSFPNYQWEFFDNFKGDYLDQAYAARLSISMAGYNTVYEALGARLPMIVSPWAAPGEDEQLKRAMLLKEKGYLEILNMNSAKQQINFALKNNCSYPEISLNGAEKSADILCN